MTTALIVALSTGIPALVAAIGTLVHSTNTATRLSAVEPIVKDVSNLAHETATDLAAHKASVETPKGVS